MKEEKVPEIEKDVTPPNENTPAGFWSKLTMKKPQKLVTEEIKSPPVAKQQESDLTDSLKIEDKDKEVERKEIKSQDLTAMKENNNVNVADKEIANDNQIEQETLCFQEPLQIKPVTDDSQHNKHVFEVKIPEQATNLMKSAKVFPEDLDDMTKEPINPVRLFDEEPDEDEEVEIEDVEDNENIQKGMSELAVTDVVEQNQAFLPTKTEIQPPSSHSTEESFQPEQPAYIHEEPIVKAPKSRSSDATLTPERTKTVTFAEETKEIPDVPYGQSQKGILIVNGTNRQEQGKNLDLTFHYASNGYIWLHKM